MTDASEHTPAQEPDKDPEPSERSVSYLTWLLIAAMGLSLGFVVGMSTTPLVGTVMALFLTLTGGAVTALAGLEGRVVPVSKVTVAPVALLIIGFGLGAPLGLAVRANGWLVAEQRLLIDQVDVEDLAGRYGLEDPQELRKRIYEIDFGTGGRLVTDPNDRRSTLGLKASGTNSCRDIRTALADGNYSVARGYLLDAADAAKAPGETVSPSIEEIESAASSKTADFKVLIWRVFLSECT